MKKLLLLLLLLPAFQAVSAQSALEFAKWAGVPKTNSSFPLRYGFVLPRTDWRSWDADFNRYYVFITPALMRTQQALSFTDKEGVRTMLNFNSLLPHAQLYTQTIITDPGALLGTWRVIASRTIRFTDSATLKEQIIYQLPDTLLHQVTAEAQFAVFGPKKVEIWIQKDRSGPFRKAFTRKYKLEGKRYLLLSKFLSGPSTVQAGINEKGYLLLHYPQVTENIKEGVYKTYNAVVEQLILERVKE